MAEQTLNVPQLIVFVLLAVLGVRWYLSKPSTSVSRPASGQPRTAAVNPNLVNQIADMFPQLDRRQIAWDLQRNGGNAGATTERVLSGRGLDTPPPSFNPPQPQPRPTRRAATPSKPTQPDLITRYNLKSKLSSAPEEPSSESQQQKKWSQDRNERQANLQRRREEMILAARRKMEEKAKATGVSS